MRWFIFVGAFVVAIAAWAALIPPGSAKQTSIEGRVQFVLQDAQGKPNGIALKDRTVVLFHSEALHDASPPSVGDLVSVRGYVVLHKPNLVFEQSAITDRGRIILDETQAPLPTGPYGFETRGDLSL